MSIAASLFFTFLILFLVVVVVAMFAPKSRHDYWIGYASLSTFVGMVGSAIFWIWS